MNNCLSLGTFGQHCYTYLHSSRKLMMISGVRSQNHIVNLANKKPQPQVITW
ncbi:hypothetical protein [Calothrix sp. UHCC 0171]|uniref:hypothetical protein n=1 Tax=Calothrix sp. UHCC 0171 TaxID=3110245 RepID=UPI002B2125BB|nr:hypothetical protein [Calothrix sp. UHCC 0171]MEA5572396.1 hypothetical protein [Calothrix sp. UHCC 0171]